MAISEWDIDFRTRRTRLGVVKSFWKCEKWILHKILHRPWCPIFFSELFFSTKIFILKISKNIFEISKFSIWKFLGRKFFGSKFFKMRFFQFSKKNQNFKMKIFVEKSNSEKKLDIKVDVKFYGESIFRIPRTIWQLLRKLCCRAEISCTGFTFKEGFTLWLVRLSS